MKRHHKGVPRKSKILLGAKVVAVSGYFDPLHSGHLNYIREARKLGDKLIVILNNDKQAILKKGYVFMPLKERKKVLEGVKHVDEVFVSIDKDRSVSKSLAKIKPDIFAVGADNYKNHLVEKEVCDKLGIKIVDRLAKSLIKQSSSKIIKKFLNKIACCECGGKVK